MKGKEESHTEQQVKNRTPAARPGDAQRQTAADPAGAGEGHTHSHPRWGQLHSYEQRGDSLDNAVNRKMHPLLVQMGHSPDQHELGPQGALVRDRDGKQPHGRKADQAVEAGAAEGQDAAPPPCKAKGDQGTSDQRGAHTPSPDATAGSTPLECHRASGGPGAQSAGKRPLGVRGETSAGQLGPCVALGVRV